MSGTQHTKHSIAPPVQRPSSSSLHIDDGQLYSPYARFADRHLATACRQIYIYPNVRHITFPLVYYTAAERTKDATSWPACYVAMAPHTAKPADFEESLAPKDSQLEILARLVNSHRTTPLSSFKDIDEMREASIQLEIWDKLEPEESAKNGNGNESGNGNGSRNGSGNAANGAVKGGASGKKGRGKN
ncbi:hypothetical protein F4820DRAFT_453459 [Hypoxylon rubiginosum]|uniref:Uncharacterized protein n=1 Tax=Hypoxylon rubiginosum TaxID=110542 RepID=A0ACB9YKJ7_9PEZI|nr:hypothetical protein F4820DRAFT_453459 [Hypoxylon rubiginosum]